MVSPRQSSVRIPAHTYSKILLADLGTLLSTRDLMIVFLLPFRRVEGTSLSEAILTRITGDV